MYIDYASSKPVGQTCLLFVAVALSARYFILGPEKSAHIFADVQDLFFEIRGLNATHVPELTAVRAHIVRNYSLLYPFIFKLHVACMSLAWAIMPFQIHAGFRRASYARHKRLGWLALSLLSVGIVTSLFIARPMRDCSDGGGFTSEVGFYGMALSTAFCAGMGVKNIVQVERDVQQHRVWMVRAYGCMWGSFFWFRIAMVVFLPLIPTRYSEVLGLISNLSWVVGWIGADLSLSLTREGGKQARNKSL